MEREMIREYEVIGEGFMGTYGSVVIVRHSTLTNIKRAIKRLHDHVRPEVIKQEALKQQQVLSPYVIQIHDFFVDENAILMEYCPEGFVDRLRDRLLATKNQIPLGECYDLLSQILQGLSDAHVAGVIHGDLKPANIRFGEENIPKLGDFGAARRLRKEPGPVVPGSTNWMSPEVLRGEDATEESDYFSFGIISYLILTGRHPFYADDPSCLSTEENNILSETFEVREPRELRPDIPDQISDLILTLLEREPGNRVAAGEAMRAAVDTPLVMPELSMAATEKRQDRSELSKALCEAYSNATEAFFVKYDEKEALGIVGRSVEMLEGVAPTDEEKLIAADAWALAGHIHNRGSNFLEAEQAASDALELSPDHVGALYVRGYARLQQAGTAEAAKKDLERALDLATDPRSVRTIERLLGSLESRVGTTLDRDKGD